ncbi:MAG TPA: hypothetical protein VF532_16075, partial [Candidatus Angelobacter sp.]
HLGRAFLFVLFLAAPAFAQTEIAPDQYPAPDQTAAQPAAQHATQLDQRIAEQQAILAGYRAQIKVKTEQVAAASQALQLASGVGAMETFVAQQKELQKLLQSLASAVRGAEITLAQLQSELALKARQAHRPPKHSQIVASAHPGA